MYTGEAAGKPGTDKDFWNRALQTPIHDKQLTGRSDVHYPELYRGGTGGATLPTGQVSSSALDTPLARHVSYPRPGEVQLWSLARPPASPFGKDICV